MIGRLALLLLGGMLLPLLGYANADLDQRVDALYDEELGELFLWFHQNPELSHMEHKTAARLASELEQLGYDVHTGIGGTGIVALMDNGDGPLVMFGLIWTAYPCRKSPVCPMPPPRSRSIGTAMRSM